MYVHKKALSYEAVGPLDVDYRLKKCTDNTLLCIKDVRSKTKRSNQSVLN